MSNKWERFTKEELKSPPAGGQAVIIPETPKPDLPFTEAEYKDRLRRVREVMAKNKIDLIYVTAPDSMCYLHGYSPRYFKGHGSTRFPPMTGTAIHVDHDYMIHFDCNQEKTLLFATSAIKEIRFIPDLASQEEGILIVMKGLSKEGWLGGTVGMEFWSHVPNRLVSEAFEAAFLRNGCKKIVDATKVVRSVRRIKSPQEIAYMEEATRISDLAHKAAKTILRPGITELEAYGEAVRVMTKAGGEPPAMIDGIIAGRYLNWHGFPSRRVIQKGDLVMWEPYGVYNRYHATVMRGYYLGDPPSDLVKLYRLAGKAYDILQDVAKAGTSVSEICRALKTYYMDVGIWDLREWCGGIELGISFPPDWVGEAVWDVEEETEGIFLENEITYYFGALNTLYCDVYVIEKECARRLSKIPLELIVID